MWVLRLFRSDSPLAIPETNFTQQKRGNLSLARSISLPTFSRGKKKEEEAAQESSASSIKFTAYNKSLLGSKLLGIASSAAVDRREKSF